MPEQIALSQFEVEYMITQDNKLVASINGQAHLPVDPIEYIQKQQAEFDALRFANARLSNEVETLRLVAALALNVLTNRDPAKLELCRQQLRAVLDDRGQA